MFRSSFFLLALVAVISIISSLSAAQPKKMSSRKRPLLSSTRKPVSVKICGLALVRTLDLVCTRAREILMRNETPAPSTPGKRQLHADDNPYSQTLSITDYARKRSSLVLDVRHGVSSSSRIQWHLGWRLLSSSVFSEDIAQILLITDEIHGHHWTIVINCVRSIACCSSVFLLLHGSWNKDQSRHLPDVLIESDLFVSPGYICFRWPTDEISS